MCGRQKTKSIIMANQRMNKCYYLIIDLLQKSRSYPSKKKVLEYLEENDYSTSGRTLERYFKDIRNSYGIEITYDTLERGYYIDEENSLNIDTIVKLLELVETAEIIQESIKEGKEAIEYISFGSRLKLEGLERLKPLLIAVRDKKIIHFNHTNYYADTKKEYSVEPYLLREYLNRWYVIGTVLETQKVRTFGIDRVEDLRVDSKIFKYNTSLNIRENFEDIIGMTVDDDGKLEEVVLSFTPYQGKYIKSQPIHPSQEILKDDDESLDIKMLLKGNHELIQTILMYGAEVKVIAPDWLKEEIISNYKEGLKRY